MTSLILACCYLLIGIFELNKDTGEIYTSVNIDREEKSLYNLDVMVSDKDPVEPQHNYTQVQVIISDVNDNEPKFPQDSWSLKVQENVALNSEILKVSLTP